MCITADQKRSVFSILSVFETGKAEGDPSVVTILPDGAGITYGLHQSTDGSGSLDSILLEYLARGGAYARQIRVFLPMLSRNETVRPGAKSMKWVQDLMVLLRNAGTADPIMRQAQEAVFEREYWQPAVALAQSIGLVEPLSYATVYDTVVQSSLSTLARIRMTFPERPPATGGAERDWTLAYLRARERWLAGFVGKSTEHTNLVRSTVYRPQALLRLASEGNWGLTRPFGVRLPRVAVPVK